MIQGRWMDLAFDFSKNYAGISYEAISGATVKAARKDKSHYVYTN
jgi:hypothetical protein